MDLNWMKRRRMYFRYVRIARRNSTGSGTKRKESAGLVRSSYSFVPIVARFLATGYGAREGGRERPVRRISRQVRYRTPLSVFLLGAC